MKKLIFMLALIGCFGYVRAQDHAKDSKDDRIKSLKIAFITEKLDLDSKEAAIFWPVYNEYEAQMKSLRAKQREQTKVFLAKQSPTDQESEKFISDQLTEKQAEADLLKKYSSEFKKVLPMAKAAKLMTLEHSFKQQLLKRFEQKKGHKD